MFRKRFASLVLIATLSLPVLAGCAMTMTPAIGTVYYDVKGPLTATSNEVSSKVGIATCTSILGLVAQGDASIETAMKNGGITKIHHVDYHSTGILGIYATFTVTVYGE
ncbi:MAG: TRL-like family protein [Candidatus Eisenbacteria bacterium]|nr:TRL-like family protein [Candidatus Eisenbacteria bacterium]